jgi:hypothetical protein
MATKRAKKKSSPIDEAAGGLAGGLMAAPERRALHYKVVELSSVDEHTLERTINEWVPMGWKFDGVQFAMRESSKRPSMAFMFFTREGAPLPADAIVPHLELPHRSEEEALAKLQKLTAEVDPMQTAWERLHNLAGAEPGHAVDGPGSKSLVEAERPRKTEPEDS